jgi:hypothetical protein
MKNWSKKCGKYEKEMKTEKENKRRDEVRKEEEKYGQWRVKEYEERHSVFNVVIISNNNIQLAFACAEHHRTHQHHMSSRVTCYDLFVLPPPSPSIIFFINLRHQRFIKLPSYQGEYFPWSIVGKCPSFFPEYLLRHCWWPSSTIQDCLNKFVADWNRTQSHYEQTHIWMSGVVLMVGSSGWIILKLTFEKYVVKENIWLKWLECDCSDEPRIL